MERVVFRIGLILFTQPQFFLRMCSPMNTRIPVLSRRALMSALGVSGFAVLLSACGEDSKPAGAATESPSSSSSATAVASASSSNGPSPSSSVPPHYSGKSKAPEGEYRPADFYGLRRMFRSRRRRRGIRMLRWRGCVRRCRRGRSGVIMACKLEIIAKRRNSLVKTLPMRKNPMISTLAFIRKVDGSWVEIVTSMSSTANLSTRATENTSGNSF